MSEHQGQSDVGVRVRLTASCYGGLEPGDEGVVDRREDGLWVVRFDRDGSERHIIGCNLERLRAA